MISAHRQQDWITRKPFVGGVSTHKLLKRRHFITCFEASVRRFAASSAVIQENGRELSYSELHQFVLTRSLALKQKGIAQGSLVGAYMYPDLKFLITLLGCWRLGACFIPLNPKLDEDGLRRCMRVARPDLLVTNTTLFEQARTSGLPTTAFRRDITTLQRSSPKYTLPAYVAFSSEANEDPRGILVSHRGITNVIRSQMSAMQVGPKKRILSCQPESFNSFLSTAGIGLLSGAAILFSDRESQQTAQRTQDLAHQYDLTHLDMPSTCLQQLDPEQLPLSVENIALRGRLCRSAISDQWSSRIRLMHIFGPGEATICSSLRRCYSGEKRSFLGLPLRGASYSVRDSEGLIIQHTGKGELWIGGENLAAGYMKDRRLTAQKFVESNGERFFRSGYQVKRHLGGELELLH